MTSIARERLMAAGVAIAAALLLLPGLGELDLWAPDEPRYAEIADEIARGGDGASHWLLPRLNGEAYSQKPPLYYWLAALPGLETGRVSAGEVRLPSALAGVVLVTMTFWLGRRFLTRPMAALYAAGILLTSFRFAHLARRAQLDVLLAAFETLALLFFARQEYGHGSRRGNVALFHAAVGAAVLTKGPVGLLPFLVVIAYFATERRRGAWRDWFPAWGLALSLGPAALWLASALALAPPGFFEVAVIENLFDRFASGVSHPRPFYYYVFQFPADFMPWTLLWPLAAVALVQSWRQEPRAEARGWRLAAVWLGVFFVFFSLSAEKRGLYLLPAFPAAALLCGAGLERAVAGRERLPFPLQATLGIGLLSLAIAGTVAAALSPIELAPGFALPRALGVAIAGISLGAFLLGLAASQKQHSARLQVAVALVWVFAVESSLFRVGYPALDTAKSPRAVAQAANRLAGPSGSIGLFRESALLGGLVYYGRLYGDRPVISLESAEEVAAFLESGGSLVVAGQPDLRELPGLMPRESLREGRRTLVLAVATPSAHGDSP